MLLTQANGDPARVALVVTDEPTIALIVDMMAAAEEGSPQPWRIREQARIAELEAEVVKLKAQLTECEAWIR